MKYSRFVILSWVLVSLFLPLRGWAFPKNFPTSSPVRFIMTGDSGTGEAGQYAVAAAIEKVCGELGCQFAIDAGDNIYEDGPSSDLDTQFQDKFEKPYAKLDFPFLMALGNHDQSGVVPGSGVHPENGDFEVQYSKGSSKWMLPERFYSFAAPVTKADEYKSRTEHPAVEVFVIDTNPLAPQGKPQFGWYKPWHKYDMDQRAWLRKALASSHATWKIVVGHHPYRNNGKQGNAGEYSGAGLSKGKELRKMYEQEVCGKADLILNGHDHTLQWLAPFPKCGARPEFIVSGASAKKSPTLFTDASKRPNRAYWEAYDTLGFFWAEASVDSLKIVAYTVDDQGHPSKAFERTLNAPIAASDLKKQPIAPVRIPAHSPAGH